MYTVFVRLWSYNWSCPRISQIKCCNIFLNWLLRLIVTISWFVSNAQLHGDFEFPILSETKLVVVGQILEKCSFEKLLTSKLLALRPGAYLYRQWFLVMIELHIEPNRDVKTRHVTIRGYCMASVVQST